MIDCDVPPILSYAPMYGAGVGDTPPVDSRLVLERLQDGVRITDPPNGWRAAVGQMMVAGVGVLLCVLLLTALARAWVEPEFSAVEPLILMLVGALCFTFAMGLVSRRAATRAAVIEARAGRLRVEQPGILGGGRNWPREKICELGVCAGTLDIGRRRLLTQLKVVTGRWSQTRVLGWRSRAEAEWMARILRAELGLPEPVKS